MIAVVDGRGVGAGKSYFVCNWILGHLAKGGTVYVGDSFGFLLEPARKLIADRYGVVIEDDQVRSFSREEASRLHEITAPGTDDSPVLVVYDEAQQGLNSRDWADKTKRPFFDWLCQSRHDNNDVLFVTQNRFNIDKQIVRLVTNVYCVRNMANFKVLGLGKWPLKQFLVSVIDGDLKTTQDRKWYWHDKGVFGCYRSKVMAGTHKRSGAPVPKKKLAKARPDVQKGRMLAKLLLVLGLLVAAGFWGWHQFSGWGKSKPGAAAVVPAAAPAAIPAPASPHEAAVPDRPPFDMRTERFLGVAGDWIHTDRGEYEFGKLCADGIVRSFDGRGIGIEQRNGRTLVISLPNGPSLALRKTAPASAQRRVSPSTGPLRIKQKHDRNDASAGVHSPRMENERWRSPLLGKFRSTRPVSITHHGDTNDGGGVSHGG